MVAGMVKPTKPRAYVTGIWAKSFDVICANWRALAFLCGAFAVIRYSLLYVGGGMVDLINAGLEFAFECAVLYVTCFWLITGTTKLGMRSLLRFVPRYLFLSLLVSVPSILYFLTVDGTLILTTSDIRDLAGDSTSLEHSMILVGGLIRTIFALILFLFVATWVPAVILKFDKGLLRAVKRGWRTLAFGLTGLLIGPFLFSLIVDVTYLLLGDLSIGLLAETGGGLTRLPLLFVLGALFGAGKLLIVNVLLGTVASRTLILGEERLRKDHIPGEDGLGLSAR